MSAARTPLVDRALVACLAVFPLFLLTLRGWMNVVLVLAFLLATYILVRDRAKGMQLIPENISRGWVLLLAVTLASPLTAVFLGQLFRLDFSWPAYDSAARSLICMPILFAMTHNRINMSNWLSLTAIGAIFITLIGIVASPHAWGWDGTRITTYFVDPLTFGSLTLTLGILSFVSIDLQGRDAWWLRMLKLSGFALGIYLSTLSGSRTGWLALPVVLLLWLLFNGPRHKLLAATLATSVGLVVSVMAYHYSIVVHQRIDLGVNEVLAYQWNGLNPDSSVGDRISFFRIAFFLFLQNPLGGWGYAGFLSQLNAPELTIFASKLTRESVFYHGFHNEITTNMVRSGVWGLLSSIAMFLVPAWFFISRLSSGSIPVRKLAFLATCFIICAFINGMSTEIFMLKYTASFYSLMITCLAGSLLVAEQSTTDSRAL